tara:strand:- start:62 stop:499 length:438 start_codon:yes stop_codon:yes gene_type:complete
MPKNTQPFQSIKSLISLVIILGISALFYSESATGFNSALLTINFKQIEFEQQDFVYGDSCDELWVIEPKLIKSIIDKENEKHFKYFCELAESGYCGDYREIIEDYGALIPAADHDGYCQFIPASHYQNKIELEFYGYNNNIGDIP